MARIRSVKPEFWTNEQVMDLPPLARLAFIGLWNFCDDRGVHPASARTLKAQVFAGDDITTEQMQAYVDSMIDVGLLGIFEDGGKPFWFVTGWHHQRIEKPRNKYPAPPTIPRPFDDSSPTLPGKVADQSKKRRRPLADRSSTDVDVDVDVEGDKTNTGGIAEVGGVQGGKHAESVETHADAPPSAPPPPASTGTRLANDWALPKPWGEWALHERPDMTAEDVRREAETFADHWHAKAGADARKANWQATWRNWVRRAELRRVNGSGKQARLEAHNRDVAAGWKPPEQREGGKPDEA